MTTKTEITLLPCPFCGSLDLEMVMDSVPYVTCHNCGAYGPDCRKQDRSPHSVVATWNERVAKLPESDKPDQFRGATKMTSGRCEDCPPVGYPTDKTRCTPCDRRADHLVPGRSNGDGTYEAMPAASTEPFMYVWMADDGEHIRYWTRDTAQAARREVDFRKPPMRLFTGAASVAQEPVIRVRVRVGYQSGEVLDPSIEYTSPAFDSLPDGTVMDLYAAAPVAAPPKVTDEMVTRFLGWHLPQDFAPDAGISFKPSPDPLCWPVGTNLFTDPQARAMLEYVLQDAPVAAQAQPTAHADETLADTQRQIIEAAELRGYTRAISECGQDREDAERWRYIRQFLALDDVGDEEYCLGLVVLDELLVESVTPHVWKLLSDGKRNPTVDDAIDAAWAAKGADHG